MLPSRDCIRGGPARPAASEPTSSARWSVTPECAGEALGERVPKVSGGRYRASDSIQTAQAMRTGRDAASTSRTVSTSRPEFAGSEPNA